MKELAAARARPRTRGARSWRAAVGDSLMPALEWTLAAVAAIPRGREEGICKKFGGELFRLGAWTPILLAVQFAGPFWGLGRALMLIR